MIELILANALEGSNDIKPWREEEDDFDRTGALHNTWGSDFKIDSIVYEVANGS